MKTARLLLALSAALIAASPRISLGEQLVINSEFKDYGPIDPATPLSTLPFHGWKETGAGGHALVGTTFGAFTAFGLQNGVLLTEKNQGIFQTINGTVAGNEYVIDGGYAQISKIFHPTVRISVFNGISTAPADLLLSYSYTLDADRYGDGRVNSVYAAFFTAAGSVSTILTTLEMKDGENDLGPVVSHTTVEPVPEPSTSCMALAGLACGGYTVFRRRKRT